MAWEEELKRAICEGEEERAEEIARRALDENADPWKILERGAIPGISEAGRLWQEGEYFLPDVILATEAYSQVMRLLEPLLGEGEIRSRGSVVIGSVEGDAHEIGKNIVVAMLRSSGYQVTDLGIDVKKETFVERVREYRPDVLGMGAYMTTTMRRMPEVIQSLVEAGLREGVKVIVGGAAVTEEYSKEIGADGYGKDAAQAVSLVKRLLGGG